MSEGGIRFTSGLFFRPVTLLGNADDFDSLAQLFDLCHVLIVSLVCGNRVGIISEESLVVFQCRLDQFVLDGLLLEDFVLSDEIAVNLPDLNHVSELDRLGCLAAYEEFGMRLEDAEDLLLVGDRLLIDDSATCLIDDPFSQFAIVNKFVPAELHRGVIEIAVSTPDEMSGEGLGDLVGPFIDVLNQLKKPDIQRFHRRSGLRLLGRLPGDLLGQPLDFPDQQPSVADDRGIDLTDLLNVPRQRSIGVPEESRIRGPVNVCLDGRGIESELTPVDQSPLHRRLGE